MRNNDAELIQRVLAGDDTAFSVLVKKYQKQVHALAWRKVGDFHIAEEITQDTFLKAYTRLPTLKKPQRFASWLYVIAANRCSSWLRKKRMWTQSLEQLEETNNEQLQNTTYSGYIAAENERTTAEAQREVVKKLLAKLQESERTVITLHYFGEMSCTEIGAFLGVSANTIKSRLRRAQQHLREEEPMIRAALDNFQITPNLTENIIRKISRIKPTAPSSGKPLLPWAIAVYTVAAALLMLGIGNHQYVARFQKPYSFNAASKMTIEIVEAPLVLNAALKPNPQEQVGSPNAPSKNNIPEQQPDDNPALHAETQTNESIKDYSQWALPKEAKARLGKGGINVLQFSPDGTQLAVGSNIGVWLYDVETGKELSLFAGICQSLAFSPDGRFLANGGGMYPSTEIEVWDTTTGQKVSLVDVPTSASALQFFPDSNRLISINRWGNTIHLLDIETGQVNVKSLEGRKFTSGTRYPEVDAITSDKAAIGNIDGKIQMWDTSTGKELPSLIGHAKLSVQPSDNASSDPWFTPDNKNQILALEFSPDGTHLASGSQDKTVRLWNITGKDEWTVLQKHKGQVNVLAFSADGQTLASGSTDKTVQLWDTASGSQLTTLTGHVNSITALAFSPNGSILASGSTDGTVRFWNTEDGNPLSQPITGHIEHVKAVTFLKDSTTLASVAFNGIITFWDVKTSKKSTSQVTGHRDRLMASAFSPDGTTLASVGADDNLNSGFGDFWHPDPLIRLTQVSTGHEIAILKERSNPSTLDFLSDGKTLIFSPDGKMVAAGISGNIRLWNTETTSSFDIDLSDNKSAFALALGTMLPPISVLAFSPDGTKLVSATMAGGVQVWDVKTGSFLTSLQEGTVENHTPAVVEYTDSISALAFSPSGKLLASGSIKQIHLWNADTDTKLFSIDNHNYKEFFHGAQALVFSPDGTILISGDGNGKIKLWDATTGDKRITLNGHTDQVETLLFSSDGKTLVSAGKDGIILLWDWEQILKGPSSHTIENGFQ